MSEVLLVVGVVLVVVAHWRPAVVAAITIAVAPLHLYRWSLPSDIAGVSLPSGNVSLFRVSVAALAAAGMTRLALIVLKRELTWDRRSRITALLICAGLVLCAYEAYEGYRGLTSLGNTATAANVFFVAAAVALAVALLHDWLRPQTAVLVALASATPQFAYALIQFFGPGSAEDKYNTPIPFAALLDAPERSDQVRPGGLTSGLFRPAGTFSDPNFLAVFAVATLILADLAASRRMLGSRPAATIALRSLQCAAAAVVLVTYSRTGVILIGAFLLVRYGLPVSRLITRSGSSRRRLLAVGASIAVLAVFGLGTENVLSNRQVGGSTSHHLETLRQALDLWADFPIVGAGTGNFGYVYGQPADRSSAQSFPFTVLAEQGLIGFALLGLAFWGAALWAAWRARGLDRVALGILFLLGAWFYDFPLSLDVCAVWLALLIGSWELVGMRAVPAGAPEER